MKNSIDIIQAVCSEDPPECLKESIDSILSQTVKPNRYIIVRDGALKNGQRKVLNQYARHLSLIDNSRKRGLAGSLNTAIAFSSADVLVRMDSDDVSMRYRLEVLLDEFERHPNLLVIGSAAKEIDSESRLFFTKKMPEHPNEIMNWALTRSPFIHSSVAFRRNFFNIVGNYNEAYLKAQDYELWARVIIHHPELLRQMKNIRTPLITVRLTEEFWSKRSVNNIKYGTPISLKLIHHLRVYHKLIPLFFKVLLRLAPNSVKKISYRKFR